MIYQMKKSQVYPVVWTLIFPQILTVTIATEFELLFQNLLKDIPNIPVKKLRRIKTKFRNSCEELSKLKVPYRHRKIIVGLLF